MVRFQLSNVNSSRPWRAAQPAYLNSKCPCSYTGNVHWDWWDVLVDGYKDAWIYPIHSIGFSCSILQPSQAFQALSDQSILDGLLSFVLSKTQTAYFDVFLFGQKDRETRCCCCYCCWQKVMINWKSIGEYCNSFPIGTMTTSPQMNDNTVCFYCHEFAKPPSFIGNRGLNRPLFLSATIRLQFIGQWSHRYQSVINSGQHELAIMERRGGARNWSRKE